MKIHDDGFTQSNLLGWQRAADHSKCARTQSKTAWPRARAKALDAPLLQRAWSETFSSEEQKDLLPKASADQTLRQAEREFQECGNISEFCLCKVTLSPASEGWFIKMYNCGERPSPPLVSRPRDKDAFARVRRSCNAHIYISFTRPVSQKTPPLGKRTRGRREEGEGLVDLVCPAPGGAGNTHS